MRLEFPATMPRLDQLARVDAAKTPGRKHQKRPGVKAKQRRANKLKTRAAARERERDVFNAQVRAYFLGARDTHPGA